LKRGYYLENKLKQIIKKMIKNSATYHKQISLGLLLGLLVGCASSKRVIYFQDEEEQQINETLLNYESTIQPGDILFINVTAIEAEAAVPFNIYDSPGGINIVPLPYIVNVDGEINFPVLGKIIVAQMTTKQLTNKLTELLLPYLKNPVINIRLDNFKITVLGEVRLPGSYPVFNERISIIEAIGLAGDLTIYGKRKSVILIREQNGKRTFTSIDLTNKELFNSPYFYLAQNDVIYVEPNNTKVNSSVVGPNTSAIIASLSILITLVAILIR
jgi:polysaccharide export outer membrane protein